MIREFIERDLKEIKENGFTNMSIIGDDTPSFLINIGASTLIDGDIPIIIIGFLEYTKSCYTAFLICSKDMTAKHARELKKFLFNIADILKAKRLETTSLDCDILNRWHKFLGFTLEGTKIKYCDDKDYNIWGMLWG